jgi:tRNA(fMet)-specific endonuclease VapC
MRYLVDTDWLIDILSGIGSASSTVERLSSAGVGISIVTVGEVYEGAVLSPDPQAALQRYREFLAAFPALSLTEPIMHRFAMIRAQLRQAGNLIPDLDLLIASTALEHNLTLITRNLRHYERVPDLALYRAT